MISLENIKETIADYIPYKGNIIFNNIYKFDVKTIHMDVSVDSSTELKNSLNSDYLPYNIFSAKHYTVKLKLDPEIGALFVEFFNKYKSKINSIFFDTYKIKLLCPNIHILSNHIKYNYFVADLNSSNPIINKLKNEIYGFYEDTGYLSFNFIEN